MAEKNGPEAIARRVRQAEALQLRQSGASYRAIGKQMGVDGSTAYRYVSDAIKEITLEPSMDMLRLELGRLDDMQLALRKSALEGDTRAVTASLAIMRQRADYLNLNGAIKPDVSADSKKALDSLMEAIVASAVDGDTE